MLKRLHRFFFSGRKRPTPQPNYFISTRTQTQERIRKLGMDLPSQDIVPVLDRNKILYPAPDPRAEMEGYEPDPELEWVIDLEGEKGRPFALHDLREIFNAKWRSEHNAVEIYGYASEEGRWGYALAGDSPEKFDRLKIGIRLLTAGNIKRPDLLPSLLEKIRVELRRRMAAYRWKTNIRENETVAAVVERTRQLLDLKKEFSRDVLIVLKSDTNYPGMQVWDTLLTLGLQWGDGDYFHWENLNRDHGEQFLFSVWSTSAPGYFFPEAVKAGRFNPMDLVFGFWIARNADPVHVFDAMADAVEFCQQRLGGRILNREGLPFDKGKERAELLGIVEVLNARGIVPGSHRAVRIF